MKITIGIDPSLNSTGVCVNCDGKCKYYIISSKMTKKMKQFHSDFITYLPYNKADTNKKENDYIVVERNKTNNIYNICVRIREIVQQYPQAEVFMEGISYGSVGSAALADLSGLNFALRIILHELGNTFYIVSPNQNKKFATGNGAADKDQMVFSWLTIEKHLKQITDIKIDDLADAYFLSNYYQAQKMN